MLAAMLYGVDATCCILNLLQNRKNAWLSNFGLLITMDNSSRHSKAVHKMIFHKFYHITVLIYINGMILAHLEK